MVKRLSPYEPAGARGETEKTRAMRIRRLLAPLDAEKIEIEDQSYRHEGHAGKPEGMSETHLKLWVVAGAFETLSRPQRQRLIHRLIAEEWQKGLHALSIAAHTPEEAKKKRG